LCVIVRRGAVYALWVPRLRTHSRQPCQNEKILVLIVFAFVTLLLAVAEPACAGNAGMKSAHLL
jgi:hypothetical protein